MNRLFWLSDAQWALIEPRLPHFGSPPRVDDRRVLSGIIHVLKTGMPWRDCPADYGPSTTIYNRFNRWSYRGIWQALFAGLGAQGETLETIMADSTHIKAHRAASGAKKGALKTRRSARRAVAERPKSMR
jgi:transposase